jgi:hypothetical protein
MEQNYSKETLEILGKTPNRFVRYGLSVFFLILTGILTGICFIHYPDTFKIPVMIYESKHIDETVYMDSADKYIACIKIKSADIWRIKVGSIVIITLNQYPENRYGILSGKIVQIKQNDNNHVYTVYIQLSTGLVTSFNKNLEYLSDMSGIAIIKGDDKNIFKRIFSSRIN